MRAAPSWECEPFSLVLHLTFSKKAVQAEAGKEKALWKPHLDQCTTPGRHSQTAGGSKSGSGKKSLMWRGRDARPAKWMRYCSGPFKAPFLCQLETNSHSSSSASTFPGIWTYLVQRDSVLEEVKENIVLFGVPGCWCDAHIRAHLVTSCLVRRGHRAVGSWYLETLLIFHHLHHLCRRARYSSTAPFHLCCVFDHLGQWSRWLNYALSFMSNQVMP